MNRERQTQSKLRDLVIFQPIRDKERACSALCWLFSLSPR